MSLISLEKMMEAMMIQMLQPVQNAPICCDSFKLKGKDTRHSSKCRKSKRKKRRRKKKSCQKTIVCVSKIVKDRERCQSQSCDKCCDGTDELQNERCCSKCRKKTRIIKDHEECPSCSCTPCCGNPGERQDERFCSMCGQQLLGSRPIGQYECCWKCGQLLPGYGPFVQPFTQSYQYHQQLESCQQKLDNCVQGYTEVYNQVGARENESYYDPSNQPIQYIPQLEASQEFLGRNQGYGDMGFQSLSSASLAMGYNDIGVQANVPTSQNDQDLKERLSHKEVQERRQQGYGFIGVQLNVPGDEASSQRDENLEQLISCKQLLERCQLKLNAMGGRVNEERKEPLSVRIRVCPCPRNGRREVKRVRHSISVPELSRTDPRLVKGSTSDNLVRDRYPPLCLENDQRDASLQSFSRSNRLDEVTPESPIDIASIKRLAMKMAMDRLVEVAARRQVESSENPRLSKGNTSENLGGNGFPQVCLENDQRDTSHQRFSQSNRLDEITPELSIDIASIKRLAMKMAMNKLVEGAARRQVECCENPRSSKGSTSENLGRNGFPQICLENDQRPSHQRFSQSNRLDEITPELPTDIPSIKRLAMKMAIAELVEEEARRQVERPRQNPDCVQQNEIEEEPLEHQPNFFNCRDFENPLRSRTWFKEERDQTAVLDPGAGMSTPSTFPTENYFPGRVVSRGYLQGNEQEAIDESLGYHSRTAGTRQDEGIQEQATSEPSDQLGYMTQTSMQSPCMIRNPTNSNQIFGEGRWEGCDTYGPRQNMETRNCCASADGYGYNSKNGYDSYSYPCGHTVDYGNLESQSYGQFHGPCS